MARGVGALRGFLEGFALADQASARGAEIGLRYAQMEQRRLNEALARTAAGLYAAGAQPDGTVDWTRGAGLQALNATLRDPIVGPKIMEAFSAGSPAEQQGFARVPVRFEPAPGQPGKLILRVQWRDANGNVVSEGPATVRGTNQDDDIVATFDTPQLEGALQQFIGMYAPSLIPQLQQARQFARDREAMRIVGTIRPAAEEVVVMRQPATGAATAVPGVEGPAAAAAPASAVLPASAAPAATAAAPEDPLRHLAPDQAARFRRVRDKLNERMRELGDRLAKLSPPGPDANHKGARQAKYEQDVQALREQIAQASAQYQELHRRFGVPLNAVPETVPAEQLPQTNVEPQRLQAAAQMPLAQAASSIASLETLVTRRGAPKLTDEQKDALAWLAARGKITMEQYERAMRTGRISAGDKKMLSDGLGGLWVQGEDGNIRHLKGPYSDLIVASKLPKGDDILARRKKISELVDSYAERYAWARAQGSSSAERKDFVQQLKARFFDRLDGTPALQALGIDPTNPQHFNLLWEANARAEEDERASQPGLFMRFFGAEGDRVRSLTPYILEQVVPDRTRVVGIYRALRGAGVGRDEEDMIVMAAIRKAQQERRPVEQVLAEALQQLQR